MEEATQTLVLKSAELSSKQLEGMQALFNDCYDNGDWHYVEQTLSKLRYTALAIKDETIVGSSIGDMRRHCFEPWDKTFSVILAGIVCVNSAHRREGLFYKLARLSAFASGEFIAGEPVLRCGRMAHPVSMKIMRELPNSIPRLNQSPNTIQRQVLLEVAELYGVSVNPDNFVVQGQGKPLGEPRIEHSEDNEDWAFFKEVKRERGDSLLALAWDPVAPEGW